MEYKKIVLDRYILGLVIVETGGNITEKEYLELTEVFRNRPIAESGYGYRLTVNLEWELYELPQGEEPVATEEDYISALEQLGVNAYA